MKVPQLTANFRNRRFLWTVAFGALFVTVLFSLRPVGDRGLSRRLLVADRDIPAGSPITSFFFGLVKESAAGEKIPSDAVSDQELHLLKGTLVNLPLRRGDLLRRSHLRLADPPKRISEQIPLGSRAYLVEAAAGIAGGASIKPGDKVDVLLSTGRERVVVVENVLVLETHGARDLTLAVTVTEMENLELARGQGSFGVALRNPKDGQKGAGRFRKAKAARAPIPVFHEGGL